MGLSSNANLLALTQKKSELTGKKTENDKAVSEQEPVVVKAGQTLDDTTKSLEQLKASLAKTPQDNPEYTAVLDEMNNESDETKKAELQAKLNSLSKENPEYANLVKNIENLEKTKFPEDEKTLTAEKEKETGLNQAGGEIKEKLSAIEKEIEAEKKNLSSEDAKYEVTIGAANEEGQNRGAAGITNEMYQMFEDMKEAGIVKDVDEFAEMSNSQKKALYAKLDAIQKESNQSTDYSKIKDGDKFTYTAEQMKELAQAAGYEVIPETLEPIAPSDVKLTIPTIDLDSIKIESPEKVKENAVIAESDSNIKLPRGIEFQDDKKGTSLEDFGIKDNGDGTYTSSKGQTFTVNQVNDYFRSMENSVDSKYSRLLDQAEELGLNYEGLSPKHLKDAIEEKKDLNKAEKVEAKEAKELARLQKLVAKYNIPTEGKDIAQLKADITGHDVYVEIADKLGINTDEKTVAEIDKLLLAKAKELGLSGKIKYTDIIKANKATKKAEDKTAPSASTTETSVSTNTEAPKTEYTTPEGWVKGKTYMKTPSGLPLGGGFYIAAEQDGMKGFTKPSDPGKFFYQDENGKWMSKTKKS